MTNEDPSKAVSLSLHGGTGTGKTNTSYIIAQSIYKKGMQSKFVHLLSSTKASPHEIHIDQYKDELKELIETSVKNCERSMFIFDKFDMIPSDLIDAIIPYLDDHDNLNGINYRKPIFIFIR
ncbi:torsin-1A-like [Mytilus edulis]|uniref:torsin-1A-like n=1 Tax=Mytilus edulis TaxID=6550 RepID=UPI0039F09155